MTSTIITIFMQLTFTTGFYVVDLYKTWWDSDAYCQSTYGTHLLTITDSTMNTAVKNFPITYIDYWIGFYDFYSEGDWKWIGYNDSIYTNWKTGEPSNSNKNEDCCVIYGSAHSYYGYWNDVACSGQFPFICAEPGDYPTTSPTSTPTKMLTIHPTRIPTIYPSEIPTLSPSSYPTIDPTLNPSLNPTQITTHFNYLYGLLCDNLFANVAIEYNMDRNECIELCDSMSSNCRMINYFDYFKTTNDSRCYVFDGICKIKVDGNNNTNRSLIMYNIFEQECIDYPTDWTDKIGDKCNLYKSPWCSNGNILKNVNEFDNLMDPQYGITAIEACCECGGGLNIMDDVALSFDYDLVYFEDDILCNFTSLYTKSSLKALRKWDNFVLFDICLYLMHEKNNCYFLIDTEFDSGSTQYTLFLCEYNQSNHGVETYDFSLEYVTDIKGYNYIYVNTFWFDIELVFYAPSINVSVMDYKQCKDRLLGVNDANYNMSHYNIDGVHSCYLEIPTFSPTTIPTNNPTNNPTSAPTNYPTPAPTEQPTTPAPTRQPTPAPTNNTTERPTLNPSYSPTSFPTESDGLQQSDIDIAGFELIVIVSICVIVLCLCVVLKRTSKSKEQSDHQSDGLDRSIKKQIEMEMHAMSDTAGNKIDNTAVHRASAPQLDDEKNEENNLCILCCNEIANMFNDPCGHVTYCYSCAINAVQQDVRCPNCRKQIQCKQIYNGGF